MPVTLMTGTLGLNRCESWFRTSTSSCWCFRLFRIFIIRTIAACIRPTQTTYSHTHGQFPNEPGTVGWSPGLESPLCCQYINQSYFPHLLQVWQVVEKVSKHQSQLYRPDVSLLPDQQRQSTNRTRSTNANLNLHTLLQILVNLLAFSALTLLVGRHQERAHTHTFNGPFFRDYPGKPVPER